jgi:hypothetical protein
MPRVKQSKRYDAHTGMSQGWMLYSVSLVLYRSQRQLEGIRTCEIIGQSGIDHHYMLETEFGIHPKLPDCSSALKDGRCQFINH